MTRSDSLTLSSAIDKHLFAYAAAASAAGVGLLALSHPAEAKVVYTPANQPFRTNTESLPLDLNNDGIADFYFWQYSSFGSARHEPPPLGLYRDSILIDPAQTANEVFAITSQGENCAAALPAAVKIGPGAPFKSGVGLMWEVAGDYTNQFYEFCPWHDRKRGAFLGLKFVVNGETHFGWAHVTPGSPSILNGYAYETVPNKPIETGKTSGPVAELDVPTMRTPQPAMLGALAQGARGLEIWRRPENDLQS